MATLLYYRITLVSAVIVNCILYALINNLIAKSLFQSVSPHFAEKQTRPVGKLTIQLDALITMQKPVFYLEYIFMYDHNQLRVRKSIKSK